MSAIAIHLDQRFRHGGHDLVYDEYGSGDRVVLYLHGLLIDSEINRGIAESLAEQGYRVLLLDMLGHGRSDKPAHASEYRMDSYAEQALALLDHLEVDQAVVGGVSLGANVTLLLATHHPERVRAMVLEMPVLEWAVPAAAMAFTPLLLLAHYGGSLLRLVGPLVRRIPETPIGPLNSFLHTAALPPEVIAAILHGILVGPVAPTVEQRRSLQAPALVLAHRNDLIHPFDDAENLVRQLPAGRLIRSWSAVELRVLPRRLTGEIAGFLAGVWPEPVAAASVA